MTSTIPVNTPIVDLEDTELIIAARNGNVKKIKELLEAGADVNEVNKKGQSALMVAVTRNNILSVLTLLAHPGIDVNKSDINGVFPLIYAASKGYEEIVAELLKSPTIKVNKILMKYTPISMAIFANKSDIVRRFLEDPRTVLSPELLTFALKYENPVLLGELIANPRIKEISKPENIKAARNLISSFRHMYTPKTPKFLMDWFRKDNTELSKIGIPPFISIYKAKRDYTYTFHPMMSQRGGTCASDVLFTLLFESEVLRPFFYTPFASNSDSSTDDTCILLPSSYTEPIKKKDLRAQYITALTAAKKRYDRMTSFDYSSLNTRIERRRRLSVNDSLWSEMLYPIKPNMKNTLGLTRQDYTFFIHALLELNILNIHLLPIFNVSVYDVKKPASSMPTPDTIIGIIINCKLLFEKDVNYHAVGLYKNDSSWFFIDNNFGYIHQIMDTDWVEKIMLPRLFHTVSVTDPEYTEKDIENPETKLYFLNDKKVFKELFIGTQFITIGERFYPHISPFDDFDINRYYSIPLSACVITKPVSAAAAGAATMGGSRRRNSYRRKKFNRTRKYR